MKIALLVVGIAVVAVVVFLVFRHKKAQATGPILSTRAGRGHF